MINIRQTYLPNHNSSQQPSYDEDFFDDMLGLFPDKSGYAPKAGCCGKYLYENDSWDNATENDGDYYVPKAEQELLKQFEAEIQRFNIPEYSPYVDFGVGGKNAFHRNAIKIIQKLKSNEYTAVDFCKKALKEIQSLENDYKTQFSVKTVEMDLFFPTNKRLFKETRAFGAINGLTLCNAYGLVKNGTTQDNIVTLLKYLSQLCGYGWLLITIDTNQDVESLKKAYDTPFLRRLYQSVLLRMAEELPTVNFNPSLFVYDPEFSQDTQSWQHMLRATHAQDFLLGTHQIKINKDQKIHFVNSYKLSSESFETYCSQANLNIIKSYQHATGVMIYLLKDRSCSEEHKNHSLSLHVA